MRAFSAARQLFGTCLLVEALGGEVDNRHRKLPCDSIAPEIMCKAVVDVVHGV
jgi:hypothetical protein